MMMKYKDVLIGMRKLADENVWNSTPGTGMDAPHINPQDNNPAGKSPAWYKTPHNGGDEAASAAADTYAETLLTSIPYALKVSTRGAMSSIPWAAQWAARQPYNLQRLAEVAVGGYGDKNGFMEKWHASKNGAGEFGAKDKYVIGAGTLNNLPKAMSQTADRMYGAWQESLDGFHPGMLWHDGVVKPVTQAVVDFSSAVNRLNGTGPGSITGNNIGKVRGFIANTADRLGNWAATKAENAEEKSNKLGTPLNYDRSFYRDGTAMSGLAENIAEGAGFTAFNAGMLGAAKYAPKVSGVVGAVGDALGIPDAVDSMFTMGLKNSMAPIAKYAPRTAQTVQSVATAADAGKWTFWKPFTSWWASHVK